uniref:Major facilitator superfamily (MFS) profile domain-containing protein n=1 Tax=Glossina brevipalpis TaxID=37001 RepID=A0A1A9WQ55_9MUSC
MESDKVVRSMAQWWQSINQDDYDFNNRNSMPYDQLEYEGMRTSKKMQYVAAFVVCLGSVATGTALAWTSPVFLQLSKDPNGNETLATNISSSNNESLQLNTEQLTWISSLLAVGAFFGALPSGYMADAIGRRYTAIAMDIPFIIAWLAIIFAKSAGMLYFGRFMMGISTGSFCIIVPMYISEIAEVSMRGLTGDRGGDGDVDDLDADVPKDCDEGPSTVKILDCHSLKKKKTSTSKLHYR